MRSARELAAGMLVVGFKPVTGSGVTGGVIGGGEGGDAGDVEGPGREVLRLLGLGVSGVVLFARNVAEPSRVRDLSARLKSMGRGCEGRGLMLCVDQEGGRVARLKGDTGSGVFTNVLAMRAVGRAEEAGMAGAARAAGRVLGAEVRWAGFDVNFSPVVDVDTNPANPVIGSRSFSREASVVGRLGAQLIRAMQEESGVAACAKHFPGHGDTSLDSHKALPALPHGMERLEAAELPPFRAAVEAGVAGVMSAHVLFEAVDRQYPATMSHAALGAIVRGKMGFGGVIFSDDLEMKAMADHYALEEQLVRGVSAGVDLFLICHTPELQWKAVEILAREIEAGRMPGVMESRARVEKMARRYWRPVKGGESLANVQGRLRAERELLQRVTEKYGVMGEGDPTRFM